MTKTNTVIEFSEPIALAGLDEQWKQGDRFALVEAVALCAQNDWEYPRWVRDTIDEAMINMFLAVYPKVNLDRLRPGKKGPGGIGLDGKLLADRLEKERRQSLDLLGLEIEKDNPVKLRKRIFRDAHIAELVARRCEFIPGPPAHFNGVNRAIEHLTVTLAINPDDPKTNDQFPDECWGASHSIIKRAWDKHKDKLASLYSNAPQHVGTDLYWLLSGWKPE